MSAKTSILAIGTEITSGQIANGNAAWISSRLTDLGIEVVLHEAVADDRPAIQSALDRCASVSDLVLVTGGLGPTTDDFTREEIARWVQEPLEFHPPSWQHIEDRLNRFGIQIAESNRQQCYYPRGAEVLENPQGTANAFRVRARGKTLILLPGPPSEISAVWEKARMEESLRSLFPGLSPLKLFTWECLGQSEAALGEITEAALQGSGLKTGYRVHRPYVEVKVWCPQDHLEEARPFLSKLETALTPWIYARERQDLGKDLIRALSRGEEIEILDSATGGILGERISAILREPEFGRLARSYIIATEWAGEWATGWADPASCEDWINRTLSQADPTVITLAISGFTAQGEWFIGLRDQNSVHQEKFVAPWSAPELSERIRRHATEVSINRWIDWLQRSVQ